MKRCPLCNNTFSDEANFCPMDAGRLSPAEGGAPAAAASQTPVSSGGKTVGGRFKLGAQLGGQHTGDVYAADDSQTQQQVVVKLIKPGCFPTPMVAQRTERELKQLQKVTSERVVRVLDSGKLDGQPWLAMEMVSGVTLSEMVAANGPLPLTTALRYAREVGEALAEAAKVGVIHRDVSPKNVLVTDGDHVKVLNFSLPTPVTDRILGIPEFLSPEQAEGKSVDQRSNIYSLGALLYYMVAGDPPFAGEPAAVLEQHVRATPAAPSQRAQGVEVPAEVDRIILKALEKQSSKRHLTLRQLLGELDSAAAGRPAVAVPEAPYRPTVMPSGAGAMAFGSPPSLTASAARDATVASAVVPVPGAVPGVSPGHNPAETMLGHAMFAPAATPETKTDVMAAQAEPPPDPFAPGGAAVTTLKGAVGGKKTKQGAVVVPSAPELEPAADPVRATLVDAELPLFQPSGPPPPAGVLVPRTPMPTPVAMGVAVEPAAPVEPVEPIAPVAPIAASAEPTVAPAPAPVAPAPVAPVVASPAAPPAAAAAPAALARPSGPVPPPTSSSKTAPEKRATGSSQAGGKKGRGSDEPRSGKKSKFRETMWFKKGELDEAAAASAATKPPDQVALDKADEIPIEDRYKDDGTISRSDQQRLSLKTGHTSMMPAVKNSPGVPGEQMKDDEIVNELRGGRGKIIAIVGAGVVLVAILVTYFIVSGGKKNTELPKAPPVTEEIATPPTETPAPTGTPARAVTIPGTPAPAPAPAVTPATPGGRTPR